ncbi:hypothetical protein DEO72_LG11g1520 [Vigna unguiculata]|uniref:Uncharacterized protein n=1 Tax=Vigna unguiculata TaxID=3917 RepID=A0A4D6NPQ8_VIGUN|nr:hypothetical protein DEO72_LG11g1520 [Vigna unguiculata]
MFEVLPLASILLLDFRFWFPPPPHNSEYGTFGQGTVTSNIFQLIGSLGGCKYKSGNPSIMFNCSCLLASSLAVLNVIIALNVSSIWCGEADDEDGGSAL